MKIELSEYEKTVLRQWIPEVDPAQVKVKTGRLAEFFAGCWARWQ